MKLLNKNRQTLTPEEQAIEQQYEQKAQQAYQKAKGEQRIKNATLKGQQDANRLANQKPFYQKVIGFANNIGQDLIKNSANTNPDVLFNWEQQREPKTRKRRRIKRLKP